MLGGNPPQEREKTMISSVARPPKKKRGMLCVSCGKTARPARLRFRKYALDGWKCACGEEYFDGAQADAILARNKLRLAPTSAKLGRIRSNLILRLPKLVERALNLTAGEQVRMQITGERSLQLSF